MQQNKSRYATISTEQFLFERARRRARKSGIPFDLSLNDIVIPDHCPVLGIALARRRGHGKGPGPNSPSLDRVFPALGYVRGNVRVISHRANTIKNNATVEELEKVVDYIRDHCLGATKASTAAGPVVGDGASVAKGY